ncbi:poly [ADP-ribose] polymerase 1-like [Stegodyphus dumicola]|uniref:poly [ADP-ribose] polymerase 1-like n=1 Tax=Stegodyphus dumicola TaxID=202533 RepID=UPI0015AD8F09|nr:poly [ADP-ribose] polymerase 1-like [Stegodyphus dumicola]
MDNDLPYIVEYSKSSRASCKVCKNKIEKDCLRMGIMVQSAHFDGKVPLWHHSSCFFKKKKIKTTADIANFNNIRWEDQKTIKDHVEGSGTTNNKAASKGIKEASDFLIEYAKSSRSSCRECSEKIQKGEIRIAKIDSESPDAQRYGPIPRWHHADCFVKERQTLEFTDDAETLPGFNALSDEDKEIIKGKLPPLGVKRKSETKLPVSEKKSKKADKKEDEVLKAQNKLLYDMRDKLQANLSKKDLIALLEYNGQHISKGESSLLDHLSDCLIFGALKLCPECKNSKPRYKFDGYHCSGDVTEWTKCQYVTKSPEREMFKIPKEFKEEYDFLKDYKYVKRKRLFPSNPERPSSSTNKGLPLENFRIAVRGKFQVRRELITKLVKELGGTIHDKLDSFTSLIISSPGEVEKGGKIMTRAHLLNIHVVSYNFLDAVKKGVSPAQAVKASLISSWGDDPVVKFSGKQENKQEKSLAKNFSSSMSGPQTMKVSVVGGAAVDPESGLADKTHVYQSRGDIYNAVLGKVDIAKGTNTYYKLQLLESNKGSKYWIFRAWGRVGTTIGGSKIEKMDNINDAISAFKALYFEKTNNEWQNRKNFVKQPGGLYPLDIDYGQECSELQELKPGANSKLPKPIQELICLIFDIEEMKKAMLEFEIDLKKMPLGKLSKKQIEAAYAVLTEAQQVLTDGCNPTKLLDVSNRFYTLIPHDFGLKKPPLLDNEDLIKSKIEMLESLLEIEFAYNLLKGDGAESTKDPVDEHYDKLKTDIETLTRDSEEYKHIETYLHNTHAKTHDQYTLELDEVFTIKRRGESERYKKFKGLHNKKLLWHGSRLTNYVGILSQGLRIAPPEAPVTGYMFGKGIYFADMVSKSANYCYTTKKNPTGLLLLCEVALGNMYEKTHAEFVEKLPVDKHSTKGLGMTIPDPKEKAFIGDVEVPFGKPVKSNIPNSALLYNEYIVYNANQVNIKYLLKVNFKWRRPY